MLLYKKFETHQDVNFKVITVTPLHHTWCSGVDYFPVTAHPIKGLISLLHKYITPKKEDPEDILSYKVAHSFESDSSWSHDHLHHVLITMRERDSTCLHSVHISRKIAKSMQSFRTFAWCPMQDSCFSSGLGGCLVFLGMRPFLSLHITCCSLCFFYCGVWRLFDVAMPFLQASHLHGNAQGETATVLKKDSEEQEKAPVNEFNCWEENGRQLSFVQPECEGKAGWKKSSRFQSEWRSFESEK